MGTSSHHGLRKAIGALKDSTKVGMAIVNGDLIKGHLEVAIVKATNHKEEVPKEKHVRTILVAVSAPDRSDAAFCIQTLFKRLAKTRTWTVALKSLIVLHRALRVDPFISKLIHNLGRGRGIMQSLAHFRDDSSPQAWNYSVWVRTYALYLEERIECFHLLEYDVDRDQSRNRRLDTPQLLEQLPVLQELLHRLLICKPEGAALYNHLIHYVLSMITGESVNLYIAITDGILSLIDKYFEMQRHHAVKALEIYRKALNQASQLSEFFEFCRGLHYGHGQKYLKIKPLPDSFLTAMEDYVKEAPQVLALPYTAIKDDRDAASTETTTPESDLLIDYNQDTNVQEKSSPSVISSDQLQNEVRQAVPKLEIADLLCFDDPTEEGSEVDAKNSLALVIVESENPSNAANDVSSASASTGWELALSGAPNSSGDALAESKLTRGLDRLTLDSLYNQAIARTTDQERAYNFGQVSANPFEADYNQDPFWGSSNVIPPTDLQMAAMAQQRTYIMQQQQLPPMAMVAYNPSNRSVEGDYNQNPFCGSSNVTPPTNVQMAAMAQQRTYIMQQQQRPPMAMVGYDPTNLSVEADYNQDPFCESNNVTHRTDEQMAAMAQEQTDIIKQQQQPPMAMLGYYSTNPSVEADYNQDPFCGSSNVKPPTEAQMTATVQEQTDIMQQQQQPPMAMLSFDSTNPYGNPFVEQSLPSHPPETHAGLI
ncbi:hypothetical protein REPUB_Repub18cG0050500 [Reevesia pubescens]